MSSAPLVPIDSQTEVTVTEACDRLGMTYTHGLKFIQAQSPADAVFQRRALTNRPSRCIGRANLHRLVALKASLMPPPGWKTATALATIIDRSSGTVARWLNEAGVSSRELWAGNGLRPHYPPQAETVLRRRLPTVPSAGDWVTENCLREDLIRQVPLPRFLSVMAWPDIAALSEPRLDAGNHVQPHYPPFTRQLILDLISAEDEPQIWAEGYLTVPDVIAVTGLSESWVMATLSSNYDIGMSRYSSTPQGVTTRYLPVAYLQLLPERYRRHDRRYIPLQTSKWSTSTRLVRDLTRFVPGDRARQYLRRPEVTSRLNRRRSQGRAKDRLLLPPDSLQFVLQLMAKDDLPDIQSGAFLSTAVIAARLDVPESWILRDCLWATHRRFRRIAIGPNGEVVQFIAASRLPMIRRRRLRYTRAIAGHDCTASLVTNRSALPPKEDWLESKEVTALLPRISPDRIVRLLRQAAFRLLSEWRLDATGEPARCYRASVRTRLLLEMARQDASAVQAGTHLSVRALAKAAGCRPLWARQYSAATFPRTRVLVHITPDKRVVYLYPTRYTGRLRRGWQRYRREQDQYDE